ncbi:MAG: hypothetical protein QM757_23100 [Paludibaculum sp.]
MACYISSNNNRLYAALENGFGVVAGVTAGDRFTAMSLAARQETETRGGRIRPGSRMFQGIQGGLRRRTSFQLRAYVYGRGAGQEAPRVGALLQAALGAAPVASIRIPVPLARLSRLGAFAQAHYRFSRARLWW